MTVRSSLSRWGATILRINWHSNRVSPAKIFFSVSNCMKPLVYLLLVTLAIGCSRSTTQRASAFDSTTATAKALDQYDRNGDRKLSVQELKASAALSTSSARIDKNRDGSLSEGEIRDRFRSHESLTGKSLFLVGVSAQGKPLSGAAVTFTPEPFMGEGLQSYVGTTGENGLCSLEGVGFKTLGIPNGFYQIHIIQADRGIDDVRGAEIASDLTRDVVEIAL
jgi:hypothetical protein